MARLFKSRRRCVPSLGSLALASVRHAPAIYRKNVALTRRGTRRLPGFGLLALLSLLATSGCGDPGPVRHRVQGTVTYGGKPVTFGRVVFDPDVMQDNNGPQGYAAIENGRFDTAANGGKGTSGGPMVLTLDGFEPIGDGLDATAVRPLFSGHQEHRDLPTADVELEIEIPAGAGAGP
jgi:hypothetical protein